MVKRTHSLFRLLLFPFYSIYEFIYFIALEVGLSVASILILGSVRIGVLFAGYLGWMMVAASTTPSEARLSKAARNEVERVLKELRYNFRAADQRWIPDVPRFLVWRYNNVTLETEKESLRIVGPRNILEEIIDRTSKSR